MFSYDGMGSGNNQNYKQTNEKKKKEVKKNIPISANLTRKLPGKLIFMSQQHFA